MQKVCWKKLDVVGKRGPLMGSGWGLTAATPKNSILDLVRYVKEAVAGSSRPRGFWLCNEAECGSVVDHI